MQGCSKICYLQFYLVPLVLQKLHTSSLKWTEITLLKITKSVSSSVSLFPPLFLFFPLSLLPISLYQSQNQCQLPAGGSLFAGGPHMSLALYDRPCVRQHCLTAFKKLSFALHEVSLLSNQACGSHGCISATL